VDQAERIAIAINKAISEELAGEPISFEELSVATIGVVSAYADAALAGGAKREFLVFVLWGLSEHIATLADPRDCVVSASVGLGRPDGGPVQ
jgi:hypothetical protein